MKSQIKIQIHLASFMHIIHADVQLSRLERLESGIFGRGFRDVAAAVRQTEGPLPRLLSLSSHGGQGLLSGLRSLEPTVKPCQMSRARPHVHFMPYVLLCRLERLELGTCGRGFGDVAAAAMADKGPLPGLRALKLGGAYRLKDADLQKLLACAPALEQLRLPQCSLLQDAGCIPRLCPKVR